jgi:lysyl-tRNA synthetase class 2
LTNREGTADNGPVRSEGRDRFERQRQEKLDRIKELGIEPYGDRYDGTESAQSIKSRPCLRELENGNIVSGGEGDAKCAGRIVLLRDIGKLIFLTVRDWSGTIQVGLSPAPKSSMAKKSFAPDRNNGSDKADFGAGLRPKEWKLAKLLQLGDVIGACGQLGKTRTGEITVWADNITLLSKSLLPPPEKFHGLSDVELRYRQRYVDLWANPEVMERFKKRSSIISTIREFLNERGFLEVETPMMQQQAGGAAARPFVTHANRLDLDLFLRIAPELFLKRLLVGGMEKVFEINRNFRNEGLSREHNPEFTMLELYQAYADYNVMMDLTEEITGLLVETYCGRRQVKFGEVTIDYTRPWRRVQYKQLLKEHSGCDIDDVDAVRAKARELGLDESGMDEAVVINEVFGVTVEDKLINPTFVIDYPAELCPLTRRKKDDPKYAERFELYIAGMELANAYTELNDPAVQEENFRIQLRGQEETMAKMDEDFITALKYGMPPAGGLGIGIDRLVMVLTGATSIRDVVLFPLLRPIV